MDAPPPPPPPPTHSVLNTIETKLSPGVLLIVAILAIIFFIFGLLNLLVQNILRLRRSRRRRVGVGDEGSPTAFQGQLQQLFHLHDGGVDQAFIDALPVFLYRAVIGAGVGRKDDPFDCAVCLCAELLIGPLVTMVKDKATSYLLDQYKVMDGMEDQRKILERQLPAILDVIEDAEKGASRPGVRAWLGALKTVAYEANDVFDEFKYEALRRDAKKKGHYSKLGMDVVSLFPARNSIVFRYRMGKKLRRIVQTIEVLVAEMNTFGFIHRQQAPPSNDWRKTDPFMVDSEEDIVKRSRHEEKEKIVKILLDQACDRDLIVLPIVGMGGMGKTTFAQLIYNDPEIEKYFELQRWWCVSDDFDVGNIANGICNTTEKDREKALQSLQKEVRGKRYLIVLDDVWNIRDDEKWGKLKTCLKQGGKGSAILTTSRDAEVARVMSMGIVEAHNLEKLGDKYHNLEKLGDEYLKEMIQSRAFSLQKPNSDELDGIVDKIVERCAGSPLAAKAFGSMLSTKISMQEWKDILARANICNDETGIERILKLSYDDLPPHMKQCFAFCAVFPKDYEIDVETLIRLWMAHDFIPLQEEVHLETVGREIFEKLAWRSFFQDVKQTPLEYEDRKQLRNRTICKIHDLMHDIALSVMGKKCLTITDRPNDKTLWLNSTRHLFSSWHEIGTHLDDFVKKQSPSLRTLLYDPKYYTDYSPHLSKYNSLRALQLFQLRELPVRPKHLQHLRYLSLSRNWIIKELPEGISLLYNLQTLDLSGCNRLGRLPNDMKYMTSLRHVYTNGCKSLKCMPPDLGHLTSLQTLTYFVVGASSGCSTVRELQNLNLGGELELCCLENVTEAHAKAASLINKEKLTHLSLEWRDHSRAEPVSDCHKKVLDALRPHNGLLMLRIDSYKSTGLPTWTTDPGVLLNLTELHLVGCTTCEEFPHFWHLKALQVLYLIRLDKMQSLCSDTACTSFPALKELRLHDLERLEKWVATEGTTEEELTFPLLEKFDIDNCPKLATLPEAPKLKVVQLKEEKAQLSLSIVRSRYMSLLSRLVLSIPDREATPTLQLDENHEASLTFMKLEGCSFFFPSSPSQKTIGIWKWFKKLVDLQIRSCDALIYWPEEEFQCLVSLKNLYIAECSKLIGPTQTQVKGDPTRARDQLLPHLTSLRIESCESLTELFILPPSLTDIGIGRCPNLVFIWGKEDTESESVQVEHLDTFASSEHGNDLSSTSMPEQLPSPRNYSLSSLKWLTIFSCHKLRSVSEQLDALEYLCIVRCNTLESLECLGDLPSLQTLELESCKRLASLPADLGSSPGLRWIKIKYCPDLNMKPLYESLEQRLDSLEHKDLSHARSSDPWEGPKLKDPKSWKYAIPRWRWAAVGKSH